MASQVQWGTARGTQGRSNVLLVTVSAKTEIKQKLANLGPEKSLSETMQRRNYVPVGH